MFNNKILVQIILILSLIILCSYRKQNIEENPDFLKFIYVKYGEANDAIYNPCNCKYSLWNDDTTSVITYDKNEIKKFVNQINKKGHKKIGSFGEYSMAFVYKYKKKTDTIYCGSHFISFSRTQKPERKYKDEWNFEKGYFFKGFDVKGKPSCFIPLKFIEKYEKTTGYVIKNR
jgi:hypothetical protein